ncbi:YdbL family protein [Steroidobacter sp.]|uniref:YdbL family protein n=1 Tax=Steroidobacter sp. TaxID=1978227 RepID=UPI001A51D523|nr:YdbL family protein [Steroidobacter sp.]MBL8266000.1 YdbL family protein [Steroidobacter sp.]
MRSASYKLGTVLCLAACLFVAACVTINVYFPAAAAEKAADKIIDDIWGGQGAPAKSDDKRGAVPAQSGDMLLAAAHSVLELLVPSAHAAQADLNVSTPAIRQLTQSMEERHAKLKKYYDSGAVGLTRDGLVEVRDQNLVPLPERNSTRKLVADENADRANLYREIATANGHPEWEMDIRTTFAERWSSKAAGGWYYQDKDGAWKQK